MINKRKIKILQIITKKKYNFGSRKNINNGRKEGKVIYFAVSLKKIKPTWKFSYCTQKAKWTKITQVNSPQCFCVTFGLQRERRPPYAGRFLTDFNTALLCLPDSYRSTAPAAETLSDSAFFSIGIEANAVQSFSR